MRTMLQDLTDVGPAGGPAPAWPQDLTSSDRHHGALRGGPGGLDLEAAAWVLGVDPLDVRRALRGGSTLSDLAADRDVDLQDLVHVLTLAATARVTTAVAAGHLDPGEAHALTVDLADHVDHHVRTP
ncbi:hypothetical protein [Cellulomonas bogoriensis]|nr:hypothetical protein [Cellulomonas bogoriensis]